MEEKFLKALYRGSLPIANIELKCAVLEDGTRVLTSASFFEALDRPRKGEYRISLDDGTKLPPFIGGQYLVPFITPEIQEMLKPVKYIDGESIKEGYVAELLPEICGMYLKYRRTNPNLTASQVSIINQVEILTEAFAKVGVAALIDEATGYQFTRKHDALRVLLEQYITSGLQKWLKRFPDKFFQELDRLYNNARTTSQKRPLYYGRFINAYVYDPIEEGYLKEKLDTLNIAEDGKRKARFHQWLSDFGVNQLTIQIGRVLGVMEISTNLEQFKKNIAKQLGLSIQPEIFDIIDE